MNKRRMNNLIKALKTEAGGNMFDMEQWITKGQKPPREAFRSNGKCGTKACIVGMAAIIDNNYFVIDAISLSSDFYSITAKKPSDCTIIGNFAEWLGIPRIDATRICYFEDEELWEGHEPDDTQHAINLLEAYRDGGMKKALSLA